MSRAAAVSDASSPDEVIAALRSRMRATEQRTAVQRVREPVLPVHPVLARLLPEGGLRRGGAYSLAASGSLLLALLAEPSAAGSWCGVVGMPELGAEAAEQAGVELSRLVLVPTAGERWLTVTSALAEVLPVLAVRPGGRVRDAEAARLSARLRDRGGVLLVDGPWPGSEGVLSTSEPRWSGLGAGHGHLQQRELTVTVTARRSPVPRSARMLLPGPAGSLAAAPDAVPAAGTPRLRAVG